MTQNLISLVIFSICLAMIIAWLIYLTVIFRTLTKDKKELLAKAKKAGVESIIEEQLEKIRKNEEDIRSLEKRMKYLVGMTDISITRVGIVRYNPFHDTGGDQSFSVALLDDSQNGVIISSIFGREGSRVFAKEIKSGESAHPLTEEEKLAMQKSMTRQDEDKK